MAGLFALFADTPTNNSVPWWVPVITSALSGAAGFLIPLWLKLQKEKRDESVRDRQAERQEKKEDKNEIIAGLREFIDRQQRVIDEDRLTYKKLIEEERTARLKEAEEEHANCQKKIDALQATIDKINQRVDVAVSRQQETEKIALKYQMRLAHLEEILEAKGIPFKKMEDDSATLRALPPSTKPEDPEPF